MPAKPRRLLNIETYPSEGIAQTSRFSQGITRIIAITTCALLGLLPLAFGGVEPWATTVLELGCPLLLLQWMSREAICGTFEVSLNPLFVPLSFLAALLAIQLCFNRTAYWYATWHESLLWVAYGLLFFVISQCLRRSETHRILAYFLTAFGFALSIFAMVQQFTWNGKIYWRIPNSNGGWVYGPYVNHSHYAGLMEMLVAFPLVLGITGFVRRPMRLLLEFTAIIIAGTIFLSRSVGGMLSFMVEVGFLAILLSKDRGSRRRLLVLLLVSAVIAVWVLSLGASGLWLRFATTLDPIGKGDGRLWILEDSVKMIAAHPFLGWGLGTFPVVFPTYRTFFSNLFVNEAHNDYLQLMVEMGGLGLAAMAATIILLYRRGLVHLGDWRRDPRAGVSIAALVACTGMLVHSLVDFNLHLPANAAIFVVCCALASSDQRQRLVR